MIPEGDPGLPAAGALAGIPIGDVTDRSLSALQTWRRIEPFLLPHGITRMARMTGLDHIGLPVWNAVMPNARSLSIAQGKGVTDMEARVSAAMEGLERAIAATPWPDPTYGSAAGLIAEGHECLLLPELTATGSTDLDPHEVIAWLPGQDLASGRMLHVPREAVTLDRTDVAPRFWQSSDGLASGNTVLEARFHGLMERIERDAEALFHGLPLQLAMQRVFDPQQLFSPVLDGLVSQVRLGGLSVMFFDMTTDNGIPVILCHLGPGDVTGRRHVPAIAVTGGAGAHPVPWRAAVRALTEAAQSRITFIAGNRDDIDPGIYRRPVEPWILKAFSQPPMPRTLTAKIEESDLEHLFAHALDRLAATDAGRIISVPLSDPALPFHVEKVIAPGLEHPPGARLRRHGIRALRQAIAS